VLWILSAIAFAAGERTMSEQIGCGYHSFAVKEQNMAMLIISVHMSRLRPGLPMAVQFFTSVP
jgi:hypothetical protein